MVVIGFVVVVVHVVVVVIPVFDPRNIPLKQYLKGKIKKNNLKDLVDISTILS